MTPTAPGLSGVSPKWRCPICWIVLWREVYLPLPKLYAHLWLMHRIDVSGANRRHSVLAAVDTWGEAHQRRQPAVPVTDETAAGLTPAHGQLPARRTSSVEAA